MGEAPPTPLDPVLCGISGHTILNGFIKRLLNKSKIDEVEIIQTPYGEKLQISMLYAHTLAFYYQEFLNDLISKIFSNIYE